MQNRNIRTNKTCLNCGEYVEKRFCSNCGQENVEPKETIGQVFSHFVADIFHFDGKFLSTTKYLFTKPGFLSAEYMKGRRARYYHPIKMYIFTSAVFFLIFFYFTSPDLPAMMETARESSGQKAPYTGITNVYTIEQYDSIQNTLPEEARHSLLRKKIIHKGIELTQSYSQNQILLIWTVIGNFLHNLPYLLFLLLPICAFYLKLLYWRRKVFWYSDHGIFLIHVYIFAFIVTGLLICINQLLSFANLGGRGLINFAGVVYLVYYLWRSMKNFYGASKLKTTFKFLLFSIISGLTLLCLLGLFIIIAFMQI